VDTGMGRVGASVEEAPALAEYIENSCSHLELDGIFTHLPSSDEQDLSFTHEQTARFQRVVDTIHDVIRRRVNLAHCSNSGEILDYQPAWMDMVRTGIMAYGYYPDENMERSLDLKPALSFLTRVAFIKQVKTGTTIGYGRTWTAPRDSWIATIPAGYADGFNRLFSNRGRVLIRGRFYPLVGRVCMDQSMVDLGPETDIVVGDEVVLIGRSGDQEISAYDWARELNTISYEVTCQINARVERVYDQG
jgi:alanine racemase